MALGTQFASIGRVFAGFLAAQGCWDTLADNGLPMPPDPFPPMIEFNHQLESDFEATSLSPRWVTCMDTTARSEPLGFERLPLASRPQDMQDPIHHLAIGNGRSSNGASLFIRRQNFLDSSPELIGNSPKCGITDGGTPCSLVGGETTILQESAILFNSGSIHG